MTVCGFQTSSEHSTPLGRVRYQHCVCGRFRVLPDSDVLKEGSSEAVHANRIPRTAVLIPHVSTMTMNLRQSSITYAHPLPLTAERQGMSAHADRGLDRLRPRRPSRNRGIR